MSTCYYTVVDSPIGELMLVSDGTALCRLCMSPHPEPATEGWVADPMPFGDAIRQLAEYFSGQRQVFDLPLAPAGTEFQQKVWQALREIPFGQTESYGELAERIGQPKASRAVGAANGRNPIAVIVPCHRVIGSNGTLTGFGGGLDRKSWLLAHEGAAFKPNRARRERVAQSADQHPARRDEPADESVSGDGAGAGTITDLGISAKNLDGTIAESFELAGVD